ncbi:MAG: DNA-3-methyladenine glycosylase 2 family protein [Firmicutes bacterium]|nr:DNA-3-methyladenine glycosylase 2 family protein [Bacillota bacterium]
MIIIKNTDINLNDTITCGQCFRFYKMDDNSFTIVLSDRVINIKQDDKNLIIESNNEDNLEHIINEYFDLNNDYNMINNEILKSDKTLKNNIKLSKGFKILKQDPFEMLISYIISQNNNVKRIMKSVELLSMKYGKKVIFKNNEYYLFPNFDELKSISLEDLKDIGIGFRDIYIINALKLIEDGTINLDKIYTMNTEEALNYLMLIKGVGPKVASCILLFAYKKYDVFPVDTWVIQAMKELYPNIKPNQKEIIKFAKEKYGNYSGIALQYMYHTMRNKK